MPYFNATITKEQNMAEEIWKDIVGFEGKYQVSSLGNVRSWIDSHQNKRESPFVMKKIKVTKGYHCVAIGGKLNYVHRLVAQAFLPNPNHYLVVNHIDEDKTNNNASNLEWCDAKYNCNWGNAQFKKGFSYWANKQFKKAQIETDKLIETIRNKINKGD